MARHEADSEYLDTMLEFRERCRHYRVAFPVQLMALMKAWMAAYPVERKPVVAEQLDLFDRRKYKLKEKTGRPRKTDAPKRDRFLP